MVDGFKKKLTPKQYHILREKGTEPPFSGKYWNLHDEGMYHCATCGAELFSSVSKFDSGTGWPSFDHFASRSEKSVSLASGTLPLYSTNVELRDDNSLGMHRTEVICKNCGSHLGHVFDDLPRGKAGGPTETGKRYCINSCALDFKAK